MRARRTQKCEMLFELKENPIIHSLAIQERIAKSLGEKAEVLVCKDLNEITLEEQLSCALKSQCILGDVEIAIRSRKVY